MNMQNLISNATAIVNNFSITESNIIDSSVNKSDIYTLLTFIENLQIFGADDSRVQHLRQAQKVMIPAIREAIECNWYSNDSDKSNNFYTNEVSIEIVEFVKYVLKHNVSGIVLYKDIESMFYKTFTDPHSEAIFMKHSTLESKNKVLDLETMQTLMDMIAYSNLQESIIFAPSFPQFTCTLDWYGDNTAYFVVKYENGSSEDVVLAAIKGIPTLTRGACATC